MITAREGTQSVLIKNKVLFVAAFLSTISCRRQILILWEVLNENKLWQMTNRAVFTI